ncbi:Vinorine synthase-like [Quillaja saponaria]|uniref:Vinorine synthase-like n=1 Tax=Quillaja saponaria TaxID=32244 RepID=A0AAD7LRW7_QUISA|nr:Vinorine synthase-like [Quillaja saponaria]KAJ7961901.1 Vinorine synthase-like [Quillaja saponaria]
MANKVEIVSREVVKPSCPTSQDLSIYKLSFLDQFAPAAYMPLLLFYPVDGDYNDSKVENKSQVLKTTLSETLSLFYPFAGRVKDNSIIEYNNDIGIEYLEAQVDCHLSQILKKPDPDLLKQFLPVEVESSRAGVGPLLLVQASFFECGGLAIGISVSHKIGDASTVNTFIKAWSAIALRLEDEAMKPQYVLSSLYPPVNFPIKVPPMELGKSKTATRRYVFNSSNIIELRSIVASAALQQPTRVEAVLALIWKCATTASRINLGCSTRPSLMSQMVNIRKRVIPPLPNNSVGNLLGNFIAQEEENEIELQSLVVKLRKGLEDYSNFEVKKLQEGDAFVSISEAFKKIDDLLKNCEKDFYNCTSWCRFSFYHADFGWGRPKWVSISSLRIKNTIILMDTRDSNGIEAWLTLSEEDMALVEKNEELLAFATLNPSIY